MPIIRITLLTNSAAGNAWLMSAKIPIAPRTDRNASPTGIRPATSAPNASSRMTSVTGSDVYSARWKSLSNTLLSSWLELARPNSSIRKLGLPFWADATAAMTGSIFLSASSAFPTMSNWINAEWRSFETCPSVEPSSGERRFLTACWLESVCSTDEIAAVKRGSPNVSLRSRLWTRTLSVAGCLKPASPRIFSARAVSPEPVSESESTLRPAADPRAIATTITASVPNVASFQ
jgi:hypothetical protein